MLVLDLREQVAVELSVGGRARVSPSSVGEFVPVFGCEEQTRMTEVSERERKARARGVLAETHFERGTSSVCSPRTVEAKAK